MKTIPNCLLSKIQCQEIFKSSDNLGRSILIQCFNNILKIDWMTSWTETFPVLNHSLGRETYLNSCISFFCLIIYKSLYFPCPQVKDHQRHKVGLLMKLGRLAHCDDGDLTSWGTMGHLSKRMLKRSYYRAGTCLGDFREGSRLCQEGGTIPR